MSCPVLSSLHSTYTSTVSPIFKSGWDENQLDDELNEKTWITVNNIDKSLILDTGMKDLWKTALEKQKGKFKMISKFPNNPSDN